MSRVDKALQVWESSTGVSQAAVETVERPDNAGRPPLGDYAPEASTPAESVATNYVETAASAPRPVAKTKTKSRRNPDLDARLVTTGVNAASIEQYRRLAAALHEAQAEGGLKSVMLTSAVPSEGKTLTTVNLALTLSESYAQRVLVIDADLRRPSIHTLLGMPNLRGLNEALADESVELPLRQVTERFSVMSAGRPGAMPLAGLSSPRMAVLLEECCRRFDWVLLDTPPVGLLPDAQVLARSVGAVLLVIGAGSTPAATVERAVAEIGAERIIGTVMNRVEARQTGYDAYYHQYYTRTDSDDQ
jgi:capsular exopolysaccharide synthesis family protein